MNRIFDYDDDATEFYERYRSLLGSATTASRGSPNQIDVDECNFTIRVLRATRWPLVNGEFASGLVVAEQILPYFGSHASGDFQAIPVKILVPKTLKNPPRYFLLNCHREEDVLNCAESRVRNADDAAGELERLVLDDKMVIDSSRLSSPRELFIVKYHSRLVLGPHLSASLAAVRTKDFHLEPVRDIPEPEVGRAAILKRLKAELKSRSVSTTGSEAIETSRVLECRLQLKLPALVSRYFADPPVIEDCATELFDLDRATEETQRLREWKELQWPNELVCISEDGRGGYWALDTGKVKAGDCPVMYFDHELADVDPKTGTITPNLELAAPTLKAWIKGLEAGGTGLPQLKPTRGKDTSSSRSKTARNKAQKPASKKSKAKAKKKR